MPMSERELTIATFLAVTALAKRVTGENLSITIKCMDGHIRSLTCDDESATWYDDRVEDPISSETLRVASTKHPDRLVEVTAAPRE